MNIQFATAQRVLKTVEQNKKRKSSESQCETKHNKNQKCSESQWEARKLYSDFLQVKRAILEDIDCLIA